MRTIHHEVWIGASRESVFDAVSTHAGLDGWWGPVVDAGQEIGSVVEFDHGLGAPLRMRIVDLDPNQRLEWECISEFSNPGNPGSEWSGTRLVFELRDGAPTGFDPLDAHFDGPLTILDFRHSGWAGDSRWFGFCNYAWGVTLHGLERYCLAERSGDPGA